MARKKVINTSVTNDKTTSKGEEKGPLLAGADYLLSRLPWFKWRYQDWSKTQRIVIGYLMWLVVLPVIPLTILAIWYVRDPDGFKKSPFMPILVLVTVAWFGGGLGFVNSQVPVDVQDGQVTKSSQEVVKDLTKSEPTKGREFANCTDAFNHKVFNIPRSDPSYQPRLDRDGDGLACER